MVAVVEEVTACVVTVKVAVDLPAATLTEVGTSAIELLLDKLIRMPPAGAALRRLTVPVDETPPITAVGFSENEASAGSGFAVSSAVLMTPL